MPIVIEKAYESIENQYIGFSPITTRVRPSHIANGLFRTICQSTTDTKRLIRFVITQKKDGTVPKGYELETIYLDMQKRNLLDVSSIERHELSKLRIMLKRVVAADGTVYPTDMDSYSAGQIRFISKDRTGQQGGEFVAEWLKRNSMPLFNCIRESLEEVDDIVTTLCAPVLSEASSRFIPSIDYNKLGVFTFKLDPIVSELFTGLAKAATVLSKHLEEHPNKLFRLRLAVLFSCFVVIRMLSLLEVCYLYSKEHTIPPILAVFEETKQGTISRASTMTYTNIVQSISRFYAWAFGEYLKNRYSVKELLKEPVPKYKTKNTQSIEDIWKFAQKRAKDSDEDSYTIFGGALYDMWAIQAQGNPVHFLRQLAIHSGFLYPPANRVTAKQFKLQLDCVEMIIRCCLEPGEVIDMQSLLNRLWERFGILIGGRDIDEQILKNWGAYQVDTVALAENMNEFSSILQQMSFARLYADGVIQIETGD